ncbi:MAG: VWA domain-containing protein [Deltaproteobacteria bacterium]|nr:MAG: VWA domain-containing protein [Deltaproteobacteria bacterium]
MTRRRTALPPTLFALSLLAAGLVSPRAALAMSGRRDGTPPRVEMVFALDTTGSMSSLIEGAKQKIWTIVNEVARGKPAPDIRVGLVAYRDKGDAYVTKVSQLTPDLDAVYADLMALSAGGGGDGPENVNQALADAVHRIEWSDKEVRALRVLFLVGDAPPHTDYQDVPSYEETVRQAAQRDIVVNAIRCGTWEDTGRHFAKIARLGGGEFLTIDQSGGMVAVATPYDEELARLSAEMDATYVLAGRAEKRKRAKRALDEARARAEGAGRVAAATRTIYRARGAAGGAPAAPAAAAEADLVTALETGAEAKVEETLRDEEALPEALRGLDETARRKKLEALAKKRRQLRARIDRLAEARAAWLKRNAAEKKDAFDAQVLEVVKTQATAKAGIAY